MNGREKEEYLREYEQLKKKGKAFFPYAIMKDSVMFILVAAVLVIMSLVMGAEQGPKADPTTTTYVPRPEWYFFFLFELLKVIKSPELASKTSLGGAAHGPKDHQGRRRASRVRAANGSNSSTAVRLARGCASARRLEPPPSHELQSTMCCGGFLNRASRCDMRRAISTCSHGGSDWRANRAAMAATATSSTER